LGIRQRFKRKIPAENDAVTILFTNSWHQASTGFYLRGGLDVLEAYSVVFSKHARLRLILRSKLPQDLNQRYRQIIERCNVQVIDQFLSEGEMEALFSSAENLRFTFCPTTCCIDFTSNGGRVGDRGYRWLGMAEYIDQAGMV
jgi:hypothetical protein